MTPQVINALLKVHSENEKLEFKTAGRNFEGAILFKDLRDFDPETETRSE